ncbi:hypothetical protein AAMO2058_000391600 [Amorphochlora amoebiformis]
MGLGFVSVCIQHSTYFVFPVYRGHRVNRYFRTFLLETATDVSLIRSPCPTRGIRQWRKPSACRERLLNKRLQKEVEALKTQLAKIKVITDGDKSKSDAGETSMSSTAESAIPAKPYHRKRSSKLKFPDSQEIEQKEKPMPEETVVQPFAELVYQWNVVQGQGGIWRDTRKCVLMRIDAGVRMAKRAKKFMGKMSNLHKKFAAELEKAAAEEKAKIMLMRRMESMWIKRSNRQRGSN